jgi:hypothetical protein
MGRLLRKGILAPLRTRLLSLPSTSATTASGTTTNNSAAAAAIVCEPQTSEDGDEICVVDLNALGATTENGMDNTLVGTSALEGMGGGANMERLRKRDRIFYKLERAGDKIGFVIRFSVGLRGPMMLLTGFTGRVPFSKFLWGSSVGALATLSLQLGLGYSLRHNPAAVVGVIATISTVAMAIPLCVTFFSFLSFLLHKLQRPQQSTD